MSDNSLQFAVDSSQSLDQWVFDTMIPIIIVIDQIMEQILFTFTELENGLH